MPRRARNTGRYYPRKWRTLDGQWHFSAAYRVAGRYRESVTLEVKTWEEAKYRTRLMNAALGSRSVGWALRAYRQRLEDRGCREESIKTTMYRLEGLFASDWDDPLVGVTSVRMLRLYRKYREGRAVDTHRNALNQARAFLGWCVKQGWLDSNPAADVEGVGRRRAGKGQLTADEARTLVGHCLERVPADDGALATLLALLLGLRASEVVGLRVRDLDDGGRVLHVRGTKTAAAQRAVVVPEMLITALHARTRNMGGGRQVFPRSRHWVRESVKRMCRLAGVPEVTAHGLRGTHATLATQAGASSMLVAQSIGHAGDAVTKRHYIAEGAVEAQRQRRVLKVLAGGKK